MATAWSHGCHLRRGSGQGVFLVSQRSAAGKELASMPSKGTAGCARSRVRCLLRPSRLRLVPGGVSCRLCVSQRAAAGRFVVPSCCSASRAGEACKAGTWKRCWAYHVNRSSQLSAMFRQQAGMCKNPGALSSQKQELLASKEGASSVAGAWPGAADTYTRGALWILFITVLRCAA